MQVSVFLALSLDGYIAREDGSLDWLMEGPQDSPDDTGYTGLMAEVDVLVVGRTTYDTVLGFPEWPYAGKRVVVLTHRPAEPRAGEAFFAGALPDLLARLRAEGQRRVYLDGGNAVRQGLAAGLVTDLTLFWVPRVLGSGIPLFGSGLPDIRLTLLESTALPSGIVRARYRPEHG
ncbi:dihydrofolate reductase family protein [Deinococcus sonorensis]|uniref:Dihydrofolate reductase family protein n=2 Tax=Deinococcus sonorensis TaxID=309891 RepID=A0AAU7U8W5_9DEIO